MRVLIRFAVTLASVALVAATSGCATDSALTPSQAVQRMHACTPRHDHDCYVIDAAGDLYIL